MSNQNRFAVSVLPDFRDVELDLRDRVAIETQSEFLQRGHGWTTKNSLPHLLAAAATKQQQLHYWEEPGQLDIYSFEVE